ncbi:ABC transporter substrate-binding protein [Paraliobacillus zengyii]|uniref:ABC transporter substrate-binding protein n=1 Tax=Paraliobacillus zengyii TaxID=2213194 RepID=UPI000DD4C90E|nr:ABC transporter substrate-binding protein [Paraliobacillus zengyii]
MHKKFWISLVAIISIIVLAACGNNDSEDTDSGSDDGSETYTIGASQFVEHPSLDAAYEGFKEAIADAGLDVEYDLQSAQADQNNTSTIAQGFVADNVDLIFANATPSAQAALQATKDIPILFTSVTDAVEAGLVESMDQPGENITGVMDLHPDAISNTIEFIATYFEGSTVGVVYNAGEQNSVSQIDAVKEAIDGTSLSLTERTVSTSAEVQQAATSLVGDADVIYIVTDNTVVSALEAVVGVANEQDIPLIVGEPDSLERGGFATYGIDYHTIGYRTGEMAVDILTGEQTTADIPVEYPSSMQLFINKGAAEEQGIEWNDDWDVDAEFKETVEE